MTDLQNTQVENGSQVDAGSEVERDNFLPVTLTVNGARYTLTALDPRTTLLDALREHRGLTGSKKGCDHGQCGACTVQINGQRVLAFLSLAVAHQDDEITTIEGLANCDGLHPMQAAFIECDAFQCGYCTPGQIMSAVCLLQEVLTNVGHLVREIKIAMALAATVTALGLQSSTDAAAGVLLRFR
jgi:xanthine dehydrogenase YagT iron-sulfur-binding subunit